MSSLAAGASASELRSLFKTFDADGDGAISYDELVESLEMEFSDIKNPRRQSVAQE